MIFQAKLRVDVALVQCVDGLLKAGHFSAHFGDGRVDAIVAQARAMAPAGAKIARTHKRSAMFRAVQNAHARLGS